jgi:hypothetical protein
MSFMPPMEREAHEALLNELLSPEIDHTRKTEILQTFRVDYNSVHTDFGELTESNNRFKKNNDDLLQSNSMLFRQAGMLGKDNEKDDKVVQKQFSETVTLEQLEKRV